jgi:hypothetical protein
MAIKLILVRDYKADETLGKMFVFDGLNKLYECYCLELPWLNNEHNVSCIPEGSYTVIKYSDTKHKDVFWVQDVPDRDGILIHKGNWVTGKQIDSLGCLLVGTEFMDIDQNGTIDIIHPDIALGNLNLYLPDKFKLYIV